MGLPYAVRVDPNLFRASKTQAHCRPCAFVSVSISSTCAFFTCSAPLAIVDRFEACQDSRLLQRSNHGTSRSFRRAPSGYRSIALVYEARPPLAAMKKFSNFWHRRLILVGTWAEDMAPLAGRCDDDRAGLQCRLPAQLSNEALDTLVTAREAMVIDQVLVDGFGVPALAEREFDEVDVGLAGADRRAAAGRGNRRRVGGHLIGRF
jgi:hypothetical protein